MAYLYDECFGKDESELRIFQEKNGLIPVKPGKTQEKAVFEREKNLKEINEIAGLLPNTPFKNNNFFHSSKLRILYCQLHHSPN